MTGLRADLMAHEAENRIIHGTASLSPSECPCQHWTVADMRTAHVGPRHHHPRCDGRGSHGVPVEPAVEVDGDGWCVCEWHQRWKSEVAR